MPTMIYFSARLPVLYPTDAEALFTALEDHNVPYALLDGTKDVWVRDFMPVHAPGGCSRSDMSHPIWQVLRS